MGTSAASEPLNFFIIVIYQIDIGIAGFNRKIKTDLYAYMYLSEMAPLVKVIIRSRVNLDRKSTKYDPT